MVRSLGDRSSDLLGSFQEFYSPRVQYSEPLFSLGGDLEEAEKYSVFFHL